MTLDVKVIPKASSTGFGGLMSDGCVKIKITAAPERGKANEEVCRLLSRWFEVPVRSVSIISGASSARKRVHVEAER